MVVAYFFGPPCTLHYMLKMSASSFTENNEIHKLLYVSFHGK